MPFKINLSEEGNGFHGFCFHRCMQRVRKQRLRKVENNEPANMRLVVRWVHMMNDHGEGVKDQSTSAAICYSAVTNVFLMNLHLWLPHRTLVFLKASVTPIFPRKWTTPLLHCLCNVNNLLLLFAETIGLTPHYYPYIPVLSIGASLVSLLLAVGDLELLFCAKL